MEILTHIHEIPIRRNHIQNLPYNKHLKQLLPAKRKAGILCEVLFWKQVRNKTFHGIDFDRQRIIGNYIVDFYVKNLGLVVEIDGWIHDFKADDDKNRQQELEKYGLQVFRISNHDILQNMKVAMRELEDFIIRQYGMPKTGNELLL